MRAGEATGRGQAQADELRWQERELAELAAALEEERERGRALFAEAPHGCVITDLAGLVTAANPAAAQMLGIPAHGLRGKSLCAFVAVHERERFHRWVRELSREDDAPPPAPEGTFTLHTFDRRRGFPCRLGVRPHAGDAGERALRWWLVDVSDRERARAADRLREEGRRKDEFLAVLGHELRNPLAAIALAAELMADGACDIERGRAAEIVRRHAGQLRRLVDDLLDMSRVAHGRVTLRRARVDLREVVRSAAEAAEPLVAARGHQLVIQLADAPVWVNGDAARLHQIVGNLLDNAAKYTPPHGRIEVDLRADGDTAAVLSVRDDGVGIPAHLLERVFELFEQVEGSSERAERGMGLGLALVRNLVQLHGGTVRAHSAGPGRGSQFVVQLPLDVCAAAPEPPGEDWTPSIGSRVLVVDDNIDAADLLAMVLRASHHDVVVAHTGPDALEALGEVETIEYALVDLGLPGMDGFELARRLRASQPGVVLVAVTGYGDAASRRLAAEAGFDHYLLKPVRPDEVRRILAGQAGVSRRRRQSSLAPARRRRSRRR
ncbi:MAG TPA: ATP-binding protein [Kofleriaceae bacterium]|nr:ATP-binding protein [Kofleriaceae bacterium]